MELYFKIKTVLLIGGCILSAVSLGIVGAAWIGRIIAPGTHHIADIGNMVSVKGERQ